MSATITSKPSRLSRFGNRLGEEDWWKREKSSQFAVWINSTDYVRQVSPEDFGENSVIEQSGNLHVFKSLEVVSSQGDRHLTFQPEKYTKLSS